MTVDSNKLAALVAEKLARFEPCQAAGMDRSSRAHREFNSMVGLRTAEFLAAIVSHYKSGEIACPGCDFIDADMKQFFDCGICGPKRLPCLCSNDE